MAFMQWLKLGNLLNVCLFGFLLGFHAAQHASLWVDALFLALNVLYMVGDIVTGENT